MSHNTLLRVLREAGVAAGEIQLTDHAVDLIHACGALNISCITIGPAPFDRSNRLKRGVRECIGQLAEISALLRPNRQAQGFGGRPSTQRNEGGSDTGLESFEHFVPVPVK